VSGSHSRTKGHTFERWVAKQLRTIWVNAKRGYQTRGGTQEQFDVEGTPFAIECKVGKQPNIRAAMRQVEAACKGKPPVVVSKVDRETPLVTMHFNDWFDLVAAVYGKVESNDSVQEVQ